MKIIASLLCGLSLSSTASAPAQDWRGIKPIESTCKDVERLLGGKACGQREVEYKLPTATVYIGFALSPCEQRWLGKYDVSPGTVTNLQVFFAPPYVYLSDLNIDQSKLQEGDAGDQLDILVYESRELGVNLETSKREEVITLFISPAAKHKHLLCSKEAKDPPTTTTSN